jgi:hypothetical protein
MDRQAIIAIAVINEPENESDEQGRAELIARPGKCWMELDFNLKCSS